MYIIIIITHAHTYTQAPPLESINIDYIQNLILQPTETDNKQGREQRRAKNIAGLLFSDISR